jgi:hypothetical protein
MQRERSWILLLSVAGNLGRIYHFELRRVARIVGPVGGIAHIHSQLSGPTAQCVGCLRSRRRLAASPQLSCDGFNGRLQWKGKIP